MIQTWKSYSVCSKLDFYLVSYTDNFKLDSVLMLCCEERSKVVADSEQTNGITNGGQSLHADSFKRHSI